jgi:hypothetical protein
MKKARFTRVKKYAVGLMLMMPVGLMAQQQEIQLQSNITSRKNMIRRNLYIRN